MLMVYVDDSGGPRPTWAAVADHPDHSEPLRFGGFSLRQEASMRPCCALRPPSESCTREKPGTTATCTSCTLPAFSSFRGTIRCTVGRIGWPVNSSYNFV